MQTNKLATIRGKGGGGQREYLFVKGEGKIQISRRKIVKHSSPRISIGNWEFTNELFVASLKQIGLLFTIAKANRK